MQDIEQKSIKTFFSILHQLGLTPEKDNGGSFKPDTITTIFRSRQTCDLVVGICGHDDISIQDGALFLKALSDSENDLHVKLFV